MEKLSIPLKPAKDALNILVAKFKKLLERCQKIMKQNSKGYTWTSVLILVLL